MKGERDKQFLPQIQSHPPIKLDREKQSWWNNLTEKQRQTIVSFALVLGISVVSLIAIKFAHGQYQNIVANRAENNSFGNDEPTTWAKQFKMAFLNNGWWGTDEEAVRQTLIEIPSKEDFRKVQTAYRKLYKGENLIEKLTDELKSTEFNEMLAILQSKPERAKDAGAKIYDPHNWAKRLYNAMSIYYMGIIPGTDEGAIRAVFGEIPSQKAFEDTEQAYQTLYNTSLEEDLDGDLNWSMDWREIINEKGH
jgi:hypothetical protein